MNSMIDPEIKKYLKRNIDRQKRYVITLKPSDIYITWYAGERGRDYQGPVSRKILNHAKEQGWQQPED